jgi:hypothetical protein
VPHLASFCIYGRNRRQQQCSILRRPRTAATFARPEGAVINLDATHSRREFRGKHS